MDDCFIGRPFHSVWSITKNHTMPKGRLFHQDHFATAPARPIETWNQHAFALRWKRLELLFVSFSENLKTAASPRDWRDCTLLAV